MSKHSDQINATITKVRDLDNIETMWRSLEQCCAPSFFLTWTWIGPWAKLVLKETELYLLIVSKNETPISLCFLTLCTIERSKGLVTARQIQLNEYRAKGFDMIIQYNGILATDNNQKIAWAWLFKALNNTNIIWDEVAVSSLKQSDLDDAINAAPHLSHRIDKEHATWKVLLDNECHNLDALLLKFKRKSRQQLRQSLKSFQKKYGEISYKVADSVEQAISYFEKMESLHTQRWVKEGRAGSFANENWVDFHRNVIAEGFDNGEIILMEVCSGSLIIGYIYGHLYNDVAYLQQTGFIITEDNKLRPGYVSHLQGMIFSANKNIRYYDFLPDEKNSYKKFFTEASDPVYWLRIQKPKIKFLIELFAEKILTLARSLNDKHRNIN